MNHKDGAPFVFIGSEVLLDEADVGIILAPYEGSVSYGVGTSKGPELIISASEQIESYDLEFKTEINSKVKINTCPKLEIESLSVEDALEAIYQKTKYILVRDKFPIVLGGEHTVSLGSLKAITEKHDKITYLQLDAHADLRDEYERTKHSHACVARRALEYDVQLVQVGIRSLSKEEYNFIKKNKIKTFFAPFTTEQIPEIISACTEKVYLSIDVDFFDPSILPATGTPVPGGALWEESLELFKKLFSKKNIIGIDIVELNKGSTSRSQDLIATLLYRLIGYKFL